MSGQPVKIKASLLRRLLITGVGFLVLFTGIRCSQKEAAPTSPWKNVYDTSAHYVGMQSCRTCHEPVYQTFIQSGMGQSFGYATRQKSAADFDPAHALVYDSALDFYYKPYWDHDSLYIMEFRLAGRDTVHKRIQKIDYIIGSGQHTNSHIFSVNGYLYQAPITFYTQKHMWDLAPGFEKGANSRFKRMIEAECMTCHNGYPDFVANSDNKFTALKTGIDCERCHGPGSLHVKARMTSMMVDTSKTPDYTIVNPRRLPTELQNNICQRCHLQGHAILNNGKTFFDFRPGMKLSEVMNVFLPEYEGAQDKMIMASHVERMKKSRCYLESGKMSCITCHNPHIDVKYTDRKVYINACMGCHNNAGQQSCTAPKETRIAKNDDCVLCHMPHNGSIDIPHIAVTDHYIRKKPFSDTAQSKITAFRGMQCFNNDHPDNITRARAFLEFYERYTPSKGLLDSALFYLDRDKNLEASENNNADQIRALFLLGLYPNITGIADTMMPEKIHDAWEAYRIGESYYKQLHPEVSLRWYQRAVELRKYSLDFECKYATCLLSVGNWNEAKLAYQFVLGENPDYVVANTNIGYLYMREHKMDSAFYYFDHADHLDPDYDQNLINTAVWYHTQKNMAEAKRCLEKVLAKHPDHPQAMAMMKDLLQQNP